MKALAFALLLATLASPALAGDWKVGAAAAWAGRSDVNVNIWITAPGLTGPNVAPATQMLGPFTATELRTIAAGSLEGAGRQACVHAFAYTGTNPTAPTVRSVEVTNCQSFPLAPPLLSQE